MKKPVFQHGFFWLSIFCLFFYFNPVSAFLNPAEPISDKATIPYFCKNFCVDFGLFYFKPYIPMVDYVDVIPLDNTSTFVNVDSDYFLGAHAKLDFLIPHTSNDVVIEFRGFNNGSHDSTDKPVDAELFRNLANPGTLFTIITNVNVTFGDESVATVEFLPFVQRAKGSAKYEVNVIDIDGGQYINLTDRISVRIFGGLRYTNYQADLNARYSFEQAGVEPRFEPPLGGFAVRIDANLIVNDLVDQTSEFDGIGPRLGAEFHYNFTPNLALVAMGSSSVLVGWFQDNLQDAITRTGTANVTLLEGELPPGGFDVDVLVPGIRQDVFNEFETEITRVVPNIDAKLGLQYSFPVCSKLFKSFRVEAGYYATNYFNVANRRTGIDVTEPEFLTVRYLESGFQGFYLDVGVCG